jgi:hypothetical protein
MRHTYRRLSIVTLIISFSSTVFIAADCPFSELKAQVNDQYRRVQENNFPKTEKMIDVGNGRILDCTIYGQVIEMINRIKAQETKISHVANSFESVHPDPCLNGGGKSACIFSTAQIPSAGQDLSKNLKILEPLVNRQWTGEMMSPEGGRLLKTDRNFHVVWDGSVVKITASVPEINSFSEGYFYWDREARQVAVFILSSRGVIERGTVSVEQGLLTVQGKIVFPERTFDFKNTFEFTPDGKMIDRWFQNAFGPWRPGHVVEFVEKK